MLWVSNPYRVHQRLITQAVKTTPRLLFRIENDDFKYPDLGTDLY